MPSSFPSRRAGRLAASTLVLLGLAIAPTTGATGLAGAAVTAGSATSEPCGGVAPIRPSGGSWTCAWADEFDGQALDRTKWNVMESSLWGWHSGDECYVDHPDNVSVSNGRLKLSVQKMPKVFTCYVRDTQKGWQTQHTGGMVTSYGHFAQTYGRFEIRAKFPPITIRGVQSALWLFPVEQYYGRWPLSGEIDIAEYYSSTQQVIPTMHYLGDALDPNKTNARCAVARPWEFHTYLLEWSPKMIRVSFDGVPCLTNTKWTPTGMKMPSPFDRPFDINLTQALGLGTNSPLDNSMVRTPFPATMEVDYVRVWQ